jgi:hypothetical protein
MPKITVTYREPSGEEFSAVYVGFESAVEMMCYAVALTGSARVVIVRITIDS